MKVVKQVLGLLFFLTTLGLVLGGVGFYWASKEVNKPGKLDTPVEITVAQGANIGGIADQLLYVEAIEQPALFRIAGRWTGQASKLKAGEYEVPAHASIRDILDLLESGKTIQRSVTLREGLTNFEIARILAETKNLQQTQVTLLPEGSYLPETYSFTKTESNVDVLSRMAAAMESTLDELWNKRAPDLPIKTREEAVILAAIVEKETGKPEERAKVAGVFINRLNKNIPLQSDPTVIYALTRGEHENEGQGPLGRRLLKKDLEIDSPYNTYRYPGLPPGPIANPGRAALEAVLNPERHDYIFFVADGTGGHVFAATLEEHNNNVSKWREIRKNAEQ
ncbi:MAG: endolytic transglycosylase MltG [Alphaproteobacteria bacterium]|nr:endolytic transglycosylase MltG [Alphaproteobacteria bacterium]QQS57474.1 MAG: endolytic transglycosylase MltG [Alphaproteobacteria bacterium]